MQTVSSSVLKSTVDAAENAIFVVLSHLPLFLSSSSNSSSCYLFLPIPALVEVAVLVTNDCESIFYTTEGTAECKKNSFFSVDVYDQQVIHGMQIVFKQVCQSRVGS